MRQFIAFLLILFVLAALLRVDFIFTILFFFMALYLLSRLWLGRMLAPLQVQRRFSGGSRESSDLERSFFGQEVKVELTVRNTGWLPVPWLELHESLPVQLITPPFCRQVISLAPREQRHMQYALLGRYRGYYAIGPLRLQGGGLLGIHEPRSVEVGPAHLVVYPRILPLQQLGLPTRSPLVALPARSPLFEDPSHVIGVRDYERGDSPRRIHWTATACAGRLLVKQYRPSIARETLICLDMGREGYDPSHRYTAPELAVTVAASVASHITTRDRLPVGLATQAFDPVLDQEMAFFLPPRSGRGHLMSVLEVLARVQLGVDASFSALLRRESVRLTWGATLVIITGRESEPLFETLFYLRRAGLAVALLLVQPGLPSEQLRQHAELMHIPVYRIWGEQDLKGGFGDSQRGLWR